MYLYTKLKNYYDEVFLIRSNDDFNLIEYEVVISEIREMCYERLVNILSKYIQQLELYSSAITL